MEAFRASPQQVVAWLRKRQGKLGAVQVAFEAPPPAPAFVTEVVERFEILRTVVRSQDDDEPVQIILPPEHVDVTRYSVSTTLAEALAAETAALGTPESGSNFRVAAWHDGEATMIVLTGSPVCVDPTSLQLLADVVRGSRALDSPSRLQYADVADWLWQQADAVRLSVQVEDAVDHPVAAQVAATALAVEDLDEIAAAAQREGWAVPDACHAAAVLLAWRHGIDTVHAVAPGRAHADLADAIGPFSFLTALDIAPLDGESYASLTRRTRTAFASATAAETPARLDVAAPIAIAVEAAAGSADVVSQDNHGAELLVSATDSPAYAVRLSALATPIAVSATDIARVAAAGSRGLERPVDRIATLDPQRVAALIDAARGDGEVTAPASVVEAIANRAEIDPEAVALVQHETELTYAELWSRSARARDALRAQGVGHGTPVGIHLPRSVDAVTTMLGVLRCGGVVAPLDTRSPVARRDLIVEAATVRLVVGDGTEPGEIPVADLDAGSVPAADVQVFGGDTCCAIATSGTTGRPRVVAIPHRALTNRIAWGQREYPLAAGDRVLHCASIAFDFAMWEIFAPLSAGACVVIASEGHEDDFVATTVAALVDGAATVAHFTPSVLRALVADARGAAALARLRHVFSGGEVLGEDLATRLRGLTDATVWNQYGPAEATVDATFHCVTGQELGPTIPIGRPISGVCAYVVDRAGQLVPDGVSGEIYLGGVGLANGYLGEPALTATRFVPDGLGNTGGRLYRTGDLARRNADGSLVFVGRIDDQVKVRGIRVEPDEVTIALQTHESVRGAAVIAQEIAEGDVALTAYVVGDVTLDEVRSHLDDRLPSYLIPSRLVLVDELPRTANGKLDRVALASIKPRRACAGDDYIAPSSPVEQALAAIWASVLAADQIGMTEEFFEIGGHSLNATRVVGRMREALLLDVSVRDVFQYPTIGGLIETLAARDGYDPVESEAVASLWLRTQNGR